MNKKLCYMIDLWLKFFKIIKFKFIIYEFILIKFKHIFKFEFLYLI